MGPRVLRLVGQATQMRDADRQEVRERAAGLFARLSGGRPSAEKPPSF
jgi:hypothetical protein